MRIILAIAAIAAASQAAAVEVTGCKMLLSDYPALAECQVSNTGSVPVASIRYGMTISEPGRTVPWGAFGVPGSLGPGLASIQGGAEPGETIPVQFRAPHLPERADPSRIVITVEVYEARDVTGAPIP